MAYIGRALGIGTTEKGKVAVVYAISGRSPSSRGREFNVLEQNISLENQALIGENYFPKNSKKQSVLKVDPLNGEITEDQEAQKDLIFYNAIIAQDINSRTGKPLIIVTNGTQSDVIETAHNLLPVEVLNKGRYLEGILAAMEVEPDDPNFTARIAGQFSYHGRKEGKRIIYDEQAFTIGMVTNTPDLMSATNMYLESNGLLSVISTYIGEHDGKLIPPEAKRGSVMSVASSLPVEGEDVSEICRQFVKWMDPEYVVSVAAAVLKEGEWEFDVKNIEKEKRNAGK